MDMFIGLAFGVSYIVLMPIWYPLSILADWVCENELYDYMAEKYNWKYFYRIPTMGMLLDATQNSPRWIVRALGWYFDRTVFYTARMWKNVDGTESYQDFLSHYAV